MSVCEKEGGQGWKQEAPPGASSGHENRDPSLLEDLDSFTDHGSPLVPTWQQWAQVWLVPVGVHSPAFPPTGQREANPLQETHLCDSRFKEEALQQLLTTKVIFT